MIIDQLPLLSGDAQTTDEFPIERGTTTYKVTLDRLLAALPKDAVPTEDSTNAVESGGVYNALQTKQDKITASGILKGNGSGGVTAAVAGTDYLTPDKSFSPVHNITAAVYNISATDIGATISPTYAMRNTPMTVNLTQAVSTTLPKGCEIAILNDFNSTVTLATIGVRIATPGNVASGVAGYSTTDAHTFKAAEPFSMIALKKMGNDSSGDTWLLTGNVEVVS